MCPISNSNVRKRRIWRLFSIAVMVAMLGALLLPVPGMATQVMDPVIGLSSKGSSACSDDPKASCVTKLFTVDYPHTASYEFDCHGYPVHIPWIKLLAALLGIEIPIYVPDPTPDTALCTILAQGSIFRVYESGNPTPIVENTYIGWKHEDHFAVQPNHTYELKLIGHGRDFREIVEANGLTFDSFANIAYQEWDPPDESCENPFPIDRLPYSGNLEFSGDEDWQRIQSPIQGSMLLTLDVPADKNYHLEVKSDDCSTLLYDSQNDTGVDKQIEIPVNRAYYRIHVYGSSPEDFGARYTVESSFSGDPDDNQCEKALPFDMPFNGNLEYSGDQDWQQIESPIQGTMVLTLGVPPDKDYQLEIRNDACSEAWVLSQNGTGVDERFVMPVKPVSYRVHVYGKTPNDFGDWYSVSAKWDLDDNQWENAAYFDMPYNGDLEYSGDHDWQRVQVPAGNAFLVLDVPDNRDYQFEVWRDDVKVLLGSSMNEVGTHESVRIPQPGDYRVHIFGADPSSDFNAPYQVSLLIDNVAPASAVALAGTLGNNGWYRSNVEVTLYSLDYPGGSGVQKTEYGVNYTPWIPFSGPWNVYTDPFEVTVEGHTYLVYRSTDNAGNVETSQNQLIKIDKTPPSISGAATTPPNSNGWYNTNVEVGFTASDFQSGIASLNPFSQVLFDEGANQSVAGWAVDNAGNSASFTVGNINIDKTSPTLAIISPQATAYTRSASVNVVWNAIDNLSGIQTTSAMLDSQPFSNGQAIDLFSLGLGSHTVTLQAKDKADNAASLRVPFEVTADVSSLLDTTIYAYNLGWIEKEGVFASLKASLQSAQASIERNQLVAARNQLKAFLNKLEAQKGKAIDPQAYELLTADAMYVIQYLQ